MKTDDLIDILSAEVNAVDPQRVKRVVLAFVSAALMLALAGSLATLGAGWTDKFNSFGYLALKMSFGISVVMLGTYLLLSHLRPGGKMQTFKWFALLPFGAVIGFAILELALTPASHWNKLVVGTHWLECTGFIVATAFGSSILLLLAARQAAPTDLAGTGALLGLVSGGIGAVAYALHCADDSVSFIAVWYGGAILFCAIAGALAGSRLLRW
ncbi:NrsF family protein [Pseudorhodoplanes sp.]|jgi:hypothetical protein|uniref:NrsF family protein n=1 Tax=Pseudorhodoplanes sp. TaxID=1934341 RepID=UPI003D106F21